MAWVLLVSAGLFEIAMAFCLKNSKGFSDLAYSLGFLATAAISFFLLTQALKDLPIGTAYAVWTGIGAAGTAILGIIFLKESAEVARLISIALIIAGVVGLQLTGAGH